MAKRASATPFASVCFPEWKMKEQKIPYDKRFPNPEKIFSRAETPGACQKTNQKGIINQVNGDSEKIMLMCILLLLCTENSDFGLIMALMYIMM